MSYDEKCHELAKFFLSDQKELSSPDNARELAIWIQDAIEDWINQKHNESAEVA